ncbi:Glycosyltransferase [Enhygromyxa salina]|uniref:Glycosyltransferase n=1 Tax=Enhygromyxa salina TaxID=215803 RepID=A0A0C2DD53_9BACT|nr:glycosyltransferase family 4 protein [Enhygromyxa salina]KIG19355.1 Glycosyltransferase [Enhygromyxa salina]
MKIAYLHQYFLEPSDGGGTRSWELGRRLAMAGHEVTVITSDLRVNRRGWQVERKAGMEIHRVGVRYDNGLSYRQRIAAFLRFAASAGPRARATGADVVFATSTPLTIALPAMFAARALGVPFVFEVRDLWPAVPIAMGALRNPAMITAAKSLERLAYREAAQVVALSPGMRAGVIAAGAKPGQVTMIPNACDFELFDVGPQPGARWRAEQAWLGDRPLLVYAGTLGKANGAGWLARLAHALARRGSSICIAVVGDGWEREQIQRQAARLGVLNQNFFMLGSQPKSSIPALLSGASGALSTFLQLPALHDNSANKFFDGLAAGKPVFLNHEGWLADLVRERDCGLVMPRDVEQAAALLTTKLSDPSWLRRAGAAATQLGRERFDRNDHARALEGVLTRAIARAA